MHALVTLLRCITYTGADRVHSEVSKAHLPALLMKTWCLAAAMSSVLSTPSSGSGLGRMLSALASC